MLRTTPCSLATSSLSEDVRSTTTREMYEPTSTVPATLDHVRPPSGLLNSPSP
jgi:hypothetical protein